MKLPRLLLVTHYYPEHGSGIEIVAGAIAERMAQRGVQIEWAASDSSRRARSDTRAIRRLTMSTWNWTEQRLGVPYPVWGPLSLLRLARAVARCDAVHLHDCLYFGNVAAYLLARAGGKPVLVTQHVGLVPYRSRILRSLMALANRWLGRLVLVGADRVVFISKLVQDYFEAKLRFRRQSKFVPNGVDSSIFYPRSESDRRTMRSQFGWPEEKPVLLFVGRFVEKKGLPLIRDLARRTPRCLWILIGHGPEDPASWRLPNVRCLGRRSQREIAAHCQAADLLVLPSVGEGFPLVVQEAMACGTPALISQETASGAPEAMPHLITADLKIEAIESKLWEVIPTLAGRREAVASFAAEHWDWERCTTQYCELLESTVSLPIERQRGRCLAPFSLGSKGGESGTNLLTRSAGSRAANR